MTTQYRLKIGVVLLWVSLLSPPIWWFLYVNSTVNNWGFFAQRLLGVIGMALLLIPLYRFTRGLESMYRWVDKAVALPIILVVVFAGALWFTSDTVDPPPYVGFSLVYAYFRMGLTAAVFLFWAFTLSFAKGRLTLVAALCFAASALLPYPEINNQFSFMVLDEETKASRYLSKEDLDAVMSLELDPRTIELSPPDENRVIVTSSPPNPIIITERDYVILLVAYTFMRFGRKKGGTVEDTLPPEDESSATSEEFIDTTTA